MRRRVAGGSILQARAIHQAKGSESRLPGNVGLVCGSIGGVGGKYREERKVGRHCGESCLVERWSEAVVELRKLS